MVEALEKAQTALEREARKRPCRDDDRQSVRGYMGERVGQHLDRVAVDGYPGDDTSGMAGVGMGRSPTIFDVNCTGDDGSPRDCPLL